MLLIFNDYQHDSLNKISLTSSNKYFDNIIQCTIFTRVLPNRFVSDVSLNFSRNYVTMVKNTKISKKAYEIFFFFFP